MIENVVFWYTDVLNHGHIQHFLNFESYKCFFSTLYHCVKEIFLSDSSWFFFCSIAHAELISCSPLFIPWTEVWTWYARWLVHSICANFMVVYFSNLVDQDDYLAWVLTRECSSTGAWRKIDFAFYMVVLCVRKF